MRLDLESGSKANVSLKEIANAGREEPTVTKPSITRASTGPDSPIEMRRCCPILSHRLPLRSISTGYSDEQMRDNLHILFIFPSGCARPGPAWLDSHKTWRWLDSALVYPPNWIRLLCGGSTFNSCSKFDDFFCAFCAFCAALYAFEGGALAQPY